MGSKRVLDFVLSAFFLLTSLFFIWIFQKKSKFYKNLLDIFVNNKTFVGFISLDQQKRSADLPTLKPGVLIPFSGKNSTNMQPEIIEKINMVYAKDYHVFKDIEIIIKNFTKLDD